MSPLLLVGIIFLATDAFGDVSHILQEKKLSTTDHQAINNAFSSKSTNNDDGNDFWWMKEDSPLKASYDYYKKCASTGKCPSSKPDDNSEDEESNKNKGREIDLKKNVFLNGAFPKTNGNNNNKDLISKNPFLNGGFVHAGKSKKNHHQQLDLSKNVFFNGEIGSSLNSSLNSSSDRDIKKIGYTANGDLIRNENGFIGVQPSVPFKGLNQKNRTDYVAVLGQELCNGSDQICISKENCVNGIVTGGINTVRGASVKCGKNQICCRLIIANNNNGNTLFAQSINQLVSNNSPGKSKFSGKDGLTPEQVQIIHNSQGGIRPQINLIGEFSGSSTTKSVRDLSAHAGPFFSSTPDYSNVNFGDDARNSNLEGLDYLPPHPVSPGTPPPLTTSCPPGQYLNNYGRCELVRETCPPGTRPTPSGGCEKLTPECPPNQKPGPYGGCVTISIPPTSPPPRITCPPGQKIGSYGNCVPVATPPPVTPPPTPYCPTGSRPGLNGQCINIAPQCGPGQRPNNNGGCENIPIPPRPPTPTTGSYCNAGERVGPNGECIKIAIQCGPGQRPIPGGCERIPSPPPRVTCPPGQKIGSYGNCIAIATPPPVTPPPTPYCPSGTRVGPNGQCISITPQCGQGERPIPGGCERIPPPSPPPRVTCPPGQKIGPYGNCIAIATPPPVTPYCPSGTRVGPNGQCISITPQCGQGERPIPGGCERIPSPSPPPRVTCPPGQKIGSYGNCVPVATPPPISPQPTPYCPSGTRVGPNGQCISITPQCGLGERPIPGGCERIPSPSPPPRVTCPPGQKIGSYGNCIAIATPPPVTPPPTPYCPSGTRVGPNGQCISITPQCGQGERPIPGGCERIPSPSPPPRVTCPPGQKIGSYGNCIAIATPPPVTPQPTPYYCPSGTRVGPNGQCIKITPQCGPGQRPNNNGGCENITISPRPPTPTPTPGIYCNAGERVGPNGECIKISTCPPGYIQGSFGNCSPPPTDVTPLLTCRPGQKLGPFGGCVDIERPTPAPPAPRPSTCPPGSIPTIDGGCQRLPTSPAIISCPPGTIKTSSGRCELPPSSPPPKITPCPSGSYLGPLGNCIKPATPPTYLPPKTPTITSRPSSGYDYPSPTPSFHDGSTIDSDYNPDASSDIHRPSYVRPNNYSSIPEDLIPVSCAAALKCVQEIYCTAEGFVSPVPVVLTKDQELLRVPTTDCRDLGSGTLGKCCRDPDYKDPWPSANLVDGVDNGQYAEDDSIGQYKAQYNRFSRSAINKKRTKRASSAACGIRNMNTNPIGQIPIDANFAEIPWQAMILRDSNRSLLCGGVIIRKNAVLTGAHCVEGLETSDVLIKGGEWKLGIDEEPLPFQIVKVSAIIRHGDFRVGSLQNDLAILILEENLRFTTNIGQICLPEPNLIPTQNCIATGWGKRILQLHAKNALMHRIDVNVMDVEQCQQVLQEHFKNSLPNYNTNTLCGFSNIDQCRVDYGSALACADETGRYTLSGIYSWDTGCRQQGQIAGYVAPDVDWIDSILATPIKQLKRQDRAYNSARLQQFA